MSVVIKDSKGTIKVLCKGADSILQPLLKKTKENQEIDQISQDFLEAYANEGLRTLMLVEKTMSAQDYDRWNEKY